MTEGKKPTILIVGASGSVGDALIPLFNEKNSKLILTANSRIENLRRIYPEAETLQLDLQNDTSLLECAKAICLNKPLNTVIFLAGFLAGKNLSEYNFSGIDKTITVNFTGQAKLISMIAPSMCDGGHIIFISSISGERGSYDPIYAAGKGAIISFVKSLAKSMAPRIRVNVITPGPIAGSPMLEEMSTERQRYHLERIPTGEFLSKKDLANVIVDLTRPHWRQLNGAVIRLNGGAYV